MKNSIFLKFIIHKFFHFGTIGLLIPVLILFQVDSGFSTLEISYNMGLFLFTSFILEIPTGGFADKFGRKRIFLISLLFKMVCIIIFIFKTGFFIKIGLIFFGISKSLSSGSIDAWYYSKIEESKNSETHKQLSHVETFGLIFLTIFTIIGGILPDLISSLSFKINFVLIVFLMILHFIYISITVKDIRPEVYGDKKIEIFNELRKLGEIEGLIPLLLTSVSLGGMIATIENYWQPIFKELIGDEFSYSIIGIISSILFGMSIIGNILSPYVAKFLNENRVLLLVLCRISSGIIFLIGLIFNNYILFVFSIALVFLLNGITNSVFILMINTHSPEKIRSTVFSINSLFFSLGSFLSIILIGQISIYLSLQISAVVAPILMLTSIIILIIYNLKNNKPLVSI